MEELLSALKNQITNKLSSPFYVAFIIAYIAINWDFVYTLFFESSTTIWEAKQMLKHEYIESSFIHHNEWDFYLFHFALPAFLAFLAVWIMPRIVSIPAYRKEQQYKTEKRIVKINEDRKLEKAKLELNEQQLSRLEKQSEVIEQEKIIESKDPTILWEKEYEEFSNADFFNAFISEILESIYARSGKTRIFDEYENERFKISAEALSFAHANELVELDNTENVIKLTPKGKYFAKKYSSRLRPHTNR